jgi:hypothetical protein
MPAIGLQIGREITVGFELTLAKLALPGLIDDVVNTMRTDTRQV